MKSLTEEQLQEALSRHSKYLRGEKGGELANFALTYLRSADLYGANLRSADLYGADLGSANLRGADLRGANLRSADLYGANLRSADLYGADLGSANLGSANLRGADLRGADLRGADLGSADLGGADLRGADLGSADLGGADLGSADLGSDTYLGCMLRLVGACMDAVKWVDGEDHSDLDALFQRARPDWQEWITSALGGEWSGQRLAFVVDYIVEGRS